MTLRLGELFRNWGFATDQSLIQCVQVKLKQQSDVALVATGGIRNGLQVAKSIALGATMAGVGLPLFRAAVNPPPGKTALDSVEEELLFFKKSLLISLFCCGAKNLKDLSSRIVPSDSLTK